MEVPYTPRKVTGYVAMCWAWRGRGGGRGVGVAWAWVGVMGNRWKDLDQIWHGGSLHPQEGYGLCGYV